MLPYVLLYLNIAQGVINTPRFTYFKVYFCYKYMQKLDLKLKKKKKSRDD